MKLSDRQAEYAASIAVIGKAGRFPGSRNLDQFWQNLCAGKECISFFTDEELLSSGVDPELLRRPNYVKALGTLEDADLFDAQFFGFTPREAQLIDPQQRVFLECAWEALEDAGYASDDPGMVGVFASATMSTYLRNLWNNPEILGSSDIMQLISGNDKDYVATRVSYKLNLRGPSVTVQSACSSSLVAVHLACRSLLTYDCDVALAGGVSIGVPLKQGYLYEEGGITSPDGHCRAFDAKANGTIIGCGCGVVVLKRLSEAIKDGDAIQAIIRGSAVNNDGSSKVGYTAPSVDAQADVIRAALAVARVPSETIAYVEAHGTGTLLGDPIELTALTKAFRSGGGKKSRCAIGSVKSNIGHLDAAAGVVGLIKTVLTLENKALPPSLNFETPNPKAGFDGSPFYVNTKLTEWPVNGTPRRAGVSSLGIGGTNVHVILEEAPELDKETSSRKHHLLVFSAKNQAALESLTTRIADHLDAHPDLQLADVAHTLQVGRKAFPHRRALVCETIKEAIEMLRQPNGDGVTSGRAEQRNRPVVFMFPGGGTQYPGMGQELYQQERVFRESFDKCMQLLRPILGSDLRTLIHCDAGNMESAAAALVRPSLGLPAIFANEYALARLFISWGIQPKSMIGHSLGEYAAACIAGVFSLPDALALVALRGKLFETLPAGAMLSVNLPEAGIKALSLKNVCIAAINGPDNCVISGSTNAIEQATSVLESKGIEFRRLHIDAAAHSEMVEPIVKELGSFLRRLKLSAPGIPFISNLTGTWITAEQAVDPEYWTGHLRQTVRFADGISELLKQPDIALVEIGPGHTLSTLARVQAREKSVPVISSMRHPHETAPETRVLYASLGRLWSIGVPVDWKSQYSATETRRISLPTYPFERHRFFVELTPSGEAQGVLRKKADITNWFYAPSWKQMVARKPFNIQHKAATAWMVFTDGGKLESNFIEGLRKTNDEITVVQAGPESSAFERLAEHEFRIDPANPSHYKELFAAFPDSRPANLIHFWSLNHDPALFDRAFHSVLFLTQAIGAAETANPKNLWIVSNRLAEVVQNDSPNPEKAILLGACRTIPLEYSNLHCALIDVGTQERNAASTLLQCCADRPQSSFMAYRMGRLWSQSIEPLPLPAAGESLHLRQGGLYLITGGLGQIGLTLALHLAKTVNAKLVLLDIVDLPARADWDSLLEMKSTSSATRFRINILRNLEELHTPLLIAQADVGSEELVQAVVAKAIEKFGSLNGVIHAAGKPGDGIMQFKTTAEIEAALAPKVKGTRVLENVLRDYDLDFFAACSSVASLFGEFAQIEHSSANAFLDAFCSNNSFRPSTFTVSIGWDAWKDFVTDLPQGRESAASMSAGEAAEVFDRILNLDASRLHVLVSTLDLELLSRRTNSATQAPDGSVPGVTPELYARPELSSVFVEPRNEGERQIAEVWKTVLGVKAIGVYDNFWELGGNSLLATQVVSRIKERFQIPLALRTVFEMPTVEKLAGETARLKTEFASSSRSAETSALQTTPIPRVDRKGNLALSYAQERLWFINQLDPQNLAYNVPSGVRIQGHLKVQTLARTLQEIVRRHESLRTRFVSVDGEPRQVIDPSLYVELPVTDLSHIPEPEREAEAHKLAMEEAEQPFDLERGPLLRAKLLRLGNEDHVLVFHVHHIVIDGWSIGVLVREVSAIYSSFSTRRPSPLPELEIQYADFSAWQRELLSGPVLTKQLEYWQQKLADVDPLMLPIDKPRRPMQNLGATTHFKVPLALTEELKTMGQKQGATLYMVLLAAFQALLSRYTRQYDIAVGSPIAGRSRSELEALIGCFVNMLVLRTNLDGEPDFIDLLQRVKETTLEAYAHQDVPFEKLVQVLLPQRDLTRAPLFQVVFNLLNAPWTGLQLATAKMLPFDLHAGAAQFEISLLMGETSSGMEGFIEYNTDLFEAATIDRIIRHFSLLLSAIVAEPHTPIDSLTILSPEERNMLLKDFNSNAAPIPEKTVIGLFEEQVDRTPNATAVQFGEDSLSYNELDQRANQLAHYLKKLGIGPDALVGVCLDRSFNMVVALLAVLKSGGAYVPLDPSYPADRIGFMLEDAQIRVLLAESSLRANFPAGPVQIVSMDENWKDISSNSKARIDHRVDGTSLAYVIYTSGSTGRPKGVAVPHRALANHMQWMQREFGFHSQDRVLQKTPFTFDASVWEFYAPLLVGGQLIMLQPGSHRDPRLLREAIVGGEITHIQMVPALMSALLSAESLKEAVHLRQVFCGGEALSADLAQQIWSQVDVEVVNLYGPTEGTIDTTFWRSARCQLNGNVPIGRPIGNVQIYVLDEQMALAPIGVQGELFISGDGLARGYVNSPRLTAERFIPNPFGEPGARMYRTGDLARWWADGNLEYLGRVDQQVKVRGFRIEPGEIEAALQEYAGVRQAVVVVREDTPGDKRLVAYYTWSDAAEKEAASKSWAEKLRLHAAGSLPEYMVPNAYVLLEKLPLTANGKLDRKALPAPEGDAYGVSAYEAPVGEVETKVAAIWAEVLHVERVGRHDNFFQLGGHSLLAISLIERLRQSGLQIDVRALFVQPTLADFATSINRTVEEVVVPPNRIPPEYQMITPEMLPLVELTATEIDAIAGSVHGAASNIQDIYPLAPLQEGIFFHHLMGGEADPYVLAMQFRFDSRARLQAYVEALQGVVQRHDILRTAVLWEGLRQPVQVVQRTAVLEVEEVELDAEAGDAGQQLYERFHPRRYRIDVRRAPLLRLYIARDERQGRWLMLILLHHLAGDHSTLQMICEEMQMLLQGRARELPAALPFRNLVAQARLGVPREEHEIFFRKLLGDIEEPTAPFGLMDVQGDGTGIEEARVEVDIAVAEALRREARKLGVSAASVCHLAWGRVVGHLSGREDVVFGTVLFGRMQGGEGSDRVMGLFMNTLPVRVNVGVEEVGVSLRRMHQGLADLLWHEHAPLALTQRCSRVPAPAPLFTALLNYRHNPNAEERSNVWEGVESDRAEERTNYPFMLSVDDLGRGFLLTAQTPAWVGPKRVCDFMHTALKSLVAALEKEPSKAVCSLEILPENERKQVLHGWNDTEVKYPADKNVLELFEEQVTRSPESVAVIFEDAWLSYEELNRRANQLARRLRELGAGPEKRIGLLVERSFEIVVGILGVLKAGAAYVPLDPDYPQERLSYMLQSAQLTVLLTQEHLQERQPVFAGPVLVLDGAEERKRIAEQKGENLGVALLPEHLAYIIYTSGSTGRPKGAMNSHGGLLNRLLWMQQAYRLEPEDVVLQKTPFSFDVSVWEFLWPLMVGAKLVVARPGGHQDPDYIAQLIEKREITTLHFVPSMLAVFLDEERPTQCKSLRRVVCSGEALPRELARRCLACMPWAELHNLYGPTEAAIDVTYWKCIAEDKRASIPIGRAIANMRVYVVDAELEPVPIGVAGELCLGGVGLARGYCGRGDLTAERFVPDGLSGKSGERLYRTGDLVRWLEDGNLEYLGRLDQQVKIRGFRIELGEIETALQEYPGVSQSVVIAQEDEAGDKRLVAYVVPEQAGNGSASVGLRISELREHLRRKLPEYMAPTAYVELDELPLNQNGKIDRKKLPRPDVDTPEQEYVGPRNATEETLCRVWQEVLRRERVGIHDNFFMLGGHSLLAAQVATRIRGTFNVDIPLRQMFESPTIAQLSGTINVAAQAAAANGTAPSHSRPAIKRVARKTVVLEPTFENEIRNESSNAKQEVS